MYELVDRFCEIRKHIRENIESSIEVFLTEMWDPLMKYVIIKETNDLITRELVSVFPDFPKEYLPRIKFKIFVEDNNIEVGLQNYLNKEREAIFLGTNEIDSVPFDYYIRDSWDLRFKYIFMARYGHDTESIYQGSKTAEAEYALGFMTPLAMAYGLALEDGFIS